MNVVIDTNTFLRGLGGVSPFKEVLQDIVDRCYKIVVTGDILKEYRSVAHKLGMTSYVISRKIEDLRDIGKIRLIKRSLVEKVRLSQRPRDPDDVKFLRTALASNAQYIVTVDGDLLKLNPYRGEQEYIKILKPKEYLQNNE